MKHHLIIAATLCVSLAAKETLYAQTDKQRAAQEEEQRIKQQFADEKILRKYFADHNIKPKKTISGLYYTIMEPGEGDKVKRDDVVSIYYTGKYLDGSTFDTNIDSAGNHLEALTAEVTDTRMIRGMYDGVQLLKKGGKAMLYIPSGLAYADRKSRGIPPNSILIFYIEVADVKKATPK